MTNAMRISVRTAYSLKSFRASYTPTEIGKQVDAPSRLTAEITMLRGYHDDSAPSQWRLVIN